MSSTDMSWLNSAGEMASPKLSLSSSPTLKKRLHSDLNPTIYSVYAQVFSRLLPGVFNYRHKQVN